jgi:hypothetical protein
VTGDGNLATWDDAHGLIGIAGADEVCRTRAAAASIPHPEQYIALMSDSHADAYCRLHDATGQVLGNCSESTLPTGAGPWYRMDDLASMDVAERSLPLGVPGYMPRHILYDEFAHALPAAPSEESLALTATYLAGTLINPGQDCGDWTSSSPADYAALGSAFYGFGGFAAFSASCDRPARLICLAKGAHGPPLTRPLPPSDRVAFVTSDSGSGDLSSWPNAGGATSLQAADAICTAEAASGGLARPNTFKAWLSSSRGNARSRFFHDGPLFRPDGVRVAASLDALANGTIEAPIQLEASGAPTVYDAVWTGTTADGETDIACDDWRSAGTDIGGIEGLASAADGGWTDFDNITACANAYLHIYCVGDNDSLFVGTFESGPRM